MPHPPPAPKVELVRYTLSCGHTRQTFPKHLAIALIAAREDLANLKTRAFRASLDERQFCERCSGEAIGPFHDLRALRGKWDDALGYSVRAVVEHAESARKELLWLDLLGGGESTAASLVEVLDDDWEAPSLLYPQGQPLAAWYRGLRKRLGLATPRSTSASGR